MKNLEGKLTISNPSDGMVRISVIDELSRARFLEVRVSHEELMLAIMGLAERPVTLEVQDLDRVGKTKHTKSIRALMPEHNYNDRDEKAKIAVLAEVLKMIEADGKPWIASMHFRSQDSFTTIDGKTYVNTSASYWE